MSLFDAFPDICRRDVPLGPLTWFGLGGCAEYYVEPRTEEQVAEIVRRCRDDGVPLRVLGRGANVLIRDEGVRGVILRLSAEPLCQTQYDGGSVTAGAGVDLPTLVRNTVRRGLAGLENLAGIPGTVGGGVRMNCGGRYGEIGTAVSSLRVVGPDGQIHERDHDDLGFRYRHCDLGGDLIVRVGLELAEIDPQELVRRFREVWMYKQNTQPPMGSHSAGCVFRNPDGYAAGALIDRAGLKGTRIGSVSVSHRHANFIIADRGGRAADVIALIELIRDRVEQQFGILLEPEVEIW